jgi:hypothetical protein
LGTNRLVIVRCGLLHRETVELITKHPDTGFISIETILYTHCPLYRNTAVAARSFTSSPQFLILPLCPQARTKVTSTSFCSAEKHPALSPPHWLHSLCPSTLSAVDRFSPNFYCSTLGYVTRFAETPPRFQRKEVTCFGIWTLFPFSFSLESWPSDFS